ncbi:hypothetical protein [Kitasatospora sp. NPDC001683]
MARTNDAEDDRFYEQRFLDIKSAKDRGDIDSAATLTVATVTESEFTGPNATDRTLRALNAAARRLGLSSN